MHPKFEARVRKLTTPFRVPADPPRPGVWETFRLPGQPRFTPREPVVTPLASQHVLHASKQFWDQEFEKRLNEYQQRYTLKKPT
jgi:hypothetical protein